MMRITACCDEGAGRYSRLGLPRRLRKALGYTLIGFGAMVYFIYVVMDAMARA